jgi:hypothetical protein
MTSKSTAQHKLMQIAAHTPGGYGGVPQSVGQDYAAADKKEGKYQGKTLLTRKK